MWGGFSGDEVATRTFTALAAGQGVSIDLDNGNVDGGRKVGFSLQTSGGADVLQFYFLGGASNYKYNDGTEQDTGIPFQRTGVRVQFTLNSATAYTLIVTPCGGTTTRINGTYSGTIAQLKLFNQNNTGGNDKNIYFNNFLVGGYTDNADNYSGDYAGLDKGNQPITTGNGNSTYTTPVLTTADSGTKYAVVVSGCGGSVLSSSATVTVTLPINSSVTPQDVTCNGGSDGSIAISASGAATLTYSINNGGSFQAGSTFSGLSAGSSYNIVVKDGNGCTASYSGNPVSVNQPAVVAVTENTGSHVNVTCNGGSDGTIVLNAATGGSGAGYQYSKDGGANYQAGTTFSGLTAGTYQMKAKDGNGCLSANVAVTVTQPAVVAVTENTGSHVNVTCNGGANGQIVLNAATGGSGAGYQYSKDGGANYQAGTTFGGLTAGTYQMKAQDGNGCLSANVAVTITEPAVVAVTENTGSHVNVTCNGGANGQIVLNAATGGSGAGYQYSKDGGANYQAGTTFSGLTAGTYQMKAKDGNGCLSANVAVTLTEPTVVAVTENTGSHVNVTCNGGSDGTIVLNAATGGSGAGYQYSKDGGANYQAGTTFSGLTAGTYQMKAKDGNGCLSANVPVTITQPSAVVAAAGPDKTVCPGNSVGIGGSPTGSGGTGSLTYLWTPATGLNNATIANPTASPTATTTYTVTVTDANSCTANDSVLVTVNSVATSPVTITVPSIGDTTLSYTGGAGCQFVLLKSADVTAPLSSWSVEAINTVTPGSFTIPPVGTGSPVFYDIKSE
jgi:hypothetical protein